MPTKIILCAAGQTDWDKECRIQGDLQVPLSEAGQAEIQVRAAQLLTLEAKRIYAAETLNAAQSAKILAQAMKVRAKLLPELNEIGFGLWQGLLVEEVKCRHPKAYKRWQDDPAAVCPPDGETIQHATERVTKAIDCITKRHNDEAVIVVCPRAASAVARYVLTDAPIRPLWEAPSCNGAWEVFETGD